ncbi:hypothetical protein [uncultured Nostoc sp.]|uniref:hypothetical protein n=1 Tax=uncultured Nostoc sp. TaxID=340711 RepID=UPI0035CC89F1
MSTVYQVGNAGSLPTQPSYILPMRATVFLLMPIKKLRIPPLTIVLVNLLKPESQKYQI